MVNKAPAAPGVYLMKDKNGKIIYVGKARNLKKRIKAYVFGTDSRSMVPFLIARVSDCEFIVTKTEKEALILENNLIKEHRPRYNVNFRDDKTFYSIRINPKEMFARFQLVRRPKQDGAKYFGPYPSSASAKETIRFLQSIFPLRTCSDQEVTFRKRPCLEYEIKRCLAPCVGMIDSSFYQQLVRDSVVFLEGREKKLIADLLTRMKKASEQLHFEEAAAMRDRITSIEKTLERQGVAFPDMRDRDVFGIYREEDLVQICIIYFRKGRILGKKAFPLLKSAGETSEILSSIVKQYYDGRVFIPEGIILPCAIEEREVIKEWLSEKKAHPVSVSVPRRGSSLEVLNIARSNAENVFNEEKHADHPEETMLTLERVLQLTNPPNRIECFDISNIHGHHAVGAMVTFMKGKPFKQGYRRFRIRTIEKADDYAMMYEVLSRRYHRKENMPDLIVIDGGKGQLGIAVSVLRDLDIKGPDVVAIAKGKPWEKQQHSADRAYLFQRKTPVYLSKWPAVLFFLQRVRDEAHRAAVSYYKNVKGKKDFQSMLEEIPGVGHARRRALLKFYGDVERIKTASIESLQNVQGIGTHLAGKIFTYLRG